MDAIILDDELHSAESLLILLKRYCPEINILGLETDPEIAFKKIAKHQPPLVFLDIELQVTNVFEFLYQLDFPVGVIFTTAYERHALKAIKFEPIDYLIKPIDPAELVNAVAKARRRLKGSSSARQSPKVYLERISVPTTDGLLFLDLPSIIRFEAAGSYTSVIQENGARILISKHLKAVEKMIEFSTFYRVHKTHLVNIRHIKAFVHRYGGEVILSNTERVPVARDRREGFLKKIGE